MATFKTISPIDGSIYVERELATERDIDACLKKASAIQETWKKTPLAVRAKLCLAAVEMLVSKRKAIASEICWQMGRPIHFAEKELLGVEERAHYMIENASSALATHNLPEKKNFLRFIKREPLGVVLVIAPWNYPYLTAINSIIPALMAGNVVILKHSSQTPLVAERFDDAFKQALFPEGVFQYLHITHEDTQKIIQSKRINHLCFTGSVTQGAIIEKVAAGSFLTMGLELGGKDPAYVREDANLNHAVTEIMEGAFYNSGQSCCGIERIYVHHRLFDKFVADSIAFVKKYHLGRPDKHDTTLGPLVHTQAANWVRKQIEEAIQLGAKAHIQEKDFSMSQPNTPYLAPQILTNVSHKMSIMMEETFGPAVGIMPVKDDEQAIQLMNDSPYGLTACVFSENIDKSLAIGEQLQTGTFFMNRCDYLDPGLAWSGIKNSGRGYSLSTWGYETLTRPKSFHIKSETGDF